MDSRARGGRGQASTKTCSSLAMLRRSKEHETKFHYAFIEFIYMRNENSYVVEEYIGETAIAVTRFIKLQDCV